MSSRISGGQRAQQVAYALLVLDLDVEIADHDDAALGPDAFLAARELAGLHVAFEDVDTVFLVERDARDFIEANNVVLADQAPLARGVVDEHLCHGRLTARDQMRVRGDLLEQMALAGAAWTQLDHVVVALYERNHAHEADQLGAVGQCCRLKANATQQESFPFLGR